MEVEEHHPPWLAASQDKLSSDHVNSLLAHVMLALVNSEAKH